MPKKPMIWFDDGFKNTITTAYPVMKKYGLTGITSIITGRIGQKSYRFAKRRWALMDVKDLKFLLNEGWEIASHSVTHPVKSKWGYGFSELNKPQTLYELIESKRWIKDNLGIVPTKFVPPTNTICLWQRALAKHHYKYIRPSGKVLLRGMKRRRPLYLIYHIVSRKDKMGFPYTNIERSLLILRRRGVI